MLFKCLDLSLDKVIIYISIESIVLCPNVTSYKVTALYRMLQFVGLQ